MAKDFSKTPRKRPTKKRGKGRKKKKTREKQSEEKETSLTKEIYRVACLLARIRARRQCRSAGLTFLFIHSFHSTGGKEFFPHNFAFFWCKTMIFSVAKIGLNAKLSF